MPRTRNGKWLKADALVTAGIREEFATKIAGVTHTVYLSADHDGQFVVQHTRKGYGSTTDNWKFGSDLDAARSKWKTVVKRVKNSA